MMLIMVDHHRLSINIGLQRIIGKGQRRQLEGLFCRASGSAGAASPGVITERPGESLGVRIPIFFITCYL
jgi:hypothetical protein